MQPDTLPDLRHSARGYLNAIKLCISALELSCTREEEAEFIEDVIRSSDNMVALMDRLDAYFEKAGASSSES